MRISDWSSDVCSSDLAPRSARDGVSAAFTITNLVIVGNWDSNNTVFTMHTLPVGQPPDCGAQFRSVPRHALAPADRKSGVQGKSVSVRVDLGGRRLMNKKSETTIVSTKHK